MRALSCIVIVNLINSNLGHWENLGITSRLELHHTLLNRIGSRREPRQTLAPTRGDVASWSGSNNAS